MLQPILEAGPWGLFTFMHGLQLLIIRPFTASIVVGTLILILAILAAAVAEILLLTLLTFLITITRPGVASSE